MFANVRLFEITAFSTSTGPTISGEGVKFYTPASGEQEINNVSVTLTADVSEKTYEADNLKETNSYIKGYSGSLTVYGADETALDAIYGYTKDSNGNTDLVVNKSSEKQFVMFYHGKNEKGKKYNVWLYDVEFKPFDLNEQQDSDTPQTITLNFYAKLVTINGAQKLGARVYEGNEGYVAEGTEPQSTDMYLAQEGA